MDEIEKQVQRIDAWEAAERQRKTGPLHELGGPWTERSAVVAKPGRSASEA